MTSTAIRIRTIRIYSIVILIFVDVFGTICYNTNIERYSNGSIVTIVVMGSTRTMMIRTTIINADELTHCHIDLMMDVVVALLVIFV